MIDAKKRSYSPDALSVMQHAARAHGLEAPTASSAARGEAVHPRQGALTDPPILHPQQADTATILVEGDQQAVAMLVELAKRLGLHVEPVRDLDALLPGGR